MDSPEMGEYDARVIEYNAKSHSSKEGHKTRGGVRPRNGP